MKFSYKRSLFVLLLMVPLLCSSILPMPNAFAADQSVTVSSDLLRMRSGPGLSYNVIHNLKKGQNLTVVDREGDWLKVRADQKEGWVASWYTQSASQQSTTKTSVISQVNQLNLRSEPSLSSAVIGQLKKGDTAKVLNQDSPEWVQISWKNQTGWVSKSFVNIQEQSNDAPSDNATNKNSFFTMGVEVLNVRSDADLNSKVLTTVKKGQAFEIKQMNTNWVQIVLDDKSTGWVYKFHGSFSDQKTSDNQSNSLGQLTVLYEGTNLRSTASTKGQVLYRAKAGETFKIQKKQNDWYEVKLQDGKTAYIASWVVSSDQTPEGKQTKTKSTNRPKGTLNGTTIVIDAGHGGNDRGTSAASGQAEKGLTLKTAELLAAKLRAGGANVIMTRETDDYIDLRKRVAVAHNVEADAFVSIHYDATVNRSINGFTTYYLHSYQKPLADAIHKGLSNKVTLKNRGAQAGNYLVLRENRQSAVLIELGFLSNPAEERAIDTNQFREQATLGIYNGLVDYFDHLK